MTTVVSVKNLRVWLNHQNKVIKAVDGVDFSIQKGQIFGLVGESGSGKSMTAYSLLRLLPNNATVIEGSEINLENDSLLDLSEQAMRGVRQQSISMIFQDPMSALNPVIKIANQLKECFLEANPSKESLIETLDKVHIPDAQRVLNAYPHELSGGMKQRVMIAMALAKSPKLLIADEPTTALDVTTQAQILKLILELKDNFDAAILFITHDLGVVSQVSDRVGVMYAGQLVENQSAESFFTKPLHPYSEKLFEALPENTPHRKRIPIIQGQVPPLHLSFSGCRFFGRCPKQWELCEKQIPKTLFYSDSMVRCHRFDENIASPEISTRPEKPEETIDDSVYEIEVNEPLYEAKDLKVYFPIRKTRWGQKEEYIKAVDGISLSLYEDETLALVGESGSGKTTVGKALVRLQPISDGAIHFMGRRIDTMTEKCLRKGRSYFQFVFQDSLSAMNPKMRIGDILQEGMRSLSVGTDRAEQQDRIDNLLEQVGMTPEIQYRYPHELSGGQRQRIAIARSLAVSPRVIICDEPTSALDVSVQAQILNLLQELQDNYGISYLFISHNLGVVGHIADRVAVMYQGKIVEVGDTQTILNAPAHPYTKMLLSAVPRCAAKKETAISTTTLEVKKEPIRGCPYAARCPKVMPLCKESMPSKKALSSEHEVCCHLYDKG